MNTFLFEQIENAFQLITLVILTAITIHQALSSGKEIWSLLAMFYGAVTLGNLYWFLYMLLYQETPYYDFISDFSWLAAYLFLILLLLQLRKGTVSWKRKRSFLLVPLFTFAMALFYMRWGEYLTNITYAVCMTVLLYNALAGLLEEGKTGSRRRLYGACLTYGMVEYVLWTVSCFSWDRLPVDPYLLCDVLLTGVYVDLYLVSRKAVHDELH